ncbi:MAG: M28 family peptidase [Verrucomicrobia bacterium]|nr:M28 family peptidase [Verrucomicrobiota bacterium]
MPRRLTRAPGYDGGPFFTPDGKRIVWRRFDSTGVNADVYTMRADGGDARRLTDFGAMSWAPFFHPSGRYAIFTANKLGFENFELFLVDAAGEREPVRVTDTDGFDGLPVFSPDGRKLSWTSNRTPEKQSQIFIADWNHAEALAALEKSPRRAGGGAATLATLPAGHADVADHALPARRSVGDPAISAADLRRHVEFLASPALEGRATGGAGAEKAAAYLSAELSRLGLKPLPGLANFEQPFEFTASNEVVVAENRLEFGPGERGTFAVNADFRPLSFSATASVTGQVVFAGYGLVAPGKAGEGYDSYAGLNVSNKIALVLRYVPEAVDAKRRQELNRYAGLRYKAMMARERGALALLVAAGPNSPQAGELVGLSSDGSLSGSGIAAISVGSNVVQALFRAAGKDVATFQSGLDNENPHAESGFAIPGVQVSLATAVRPIRRRDRNILALLPPTAGVKEYVVIGAHYDHLGSGDHNSLQHKDEENQFHLGADDNASGVAAVLELAEAFGTDKPQGKAPRRGLVIAFWSGEELGLLGSAHFAEHPMLPLTQMVAYVNFDMVGRLRDNKLIVQGAGSSARWRALMEKRNVSSGFSLVLQDDPYLPTDVTSLYPKGIPAINFFTGSHEDYHRPSDTAEKINYEGLERIARLAQGIARDLLNPKETLGYVKVERSGSAGGSREGLRAYLGTIPDYAAEVSGVRLSGVRGGSPADKAGLKGGDTLVGFAGQKIANIYDYTYALDAVKIGQAVDIEILRDGKRLKIAVTPEARK